MHTLDARRQTPVAPQSGAEADATNTRAVVRIRIMFAYGRLCAIIRMLFVWAYQPTSCGTTGVPAGPAHTQNLIA